MKLIHTIRRDPQDSSPKPFLPENPTVFEMAVYAIMVETARLGKGISYDTAKEMAGECREAHEAHLRICERFIKSRHFDEWGEDNKAQVIFGVPTW